MAVGMYIDIPLLPSIHSTIPISIYFSTYSTSSHSLKHLCVITTILLGSTNRSLLRADVTINNQKSYTLSGISLAIPLLTQAPQLNIILLFAFKATNFSAISLYIQTIYLLRFRKLSHVHGTTVCHVGFASLSFDSSFVAT